MSKSPLCPSCQSRPRATRQKWCAPCSAIARIKLDRPERDAVLQVAHVFAQGLPAGQAALVAVAGNRVDRGKQLTVPERIALGTIIWAWCSVLDRLGLQDKYLELAYRKLMQHDRITMAAAPFPPITPVPVPQELHIAIKAL